MKGDLTVRKTQTASGATAVQVVRYEGTRCIVVNHIGSAHDNSGLESLVKKASAFVKDHRKQPDLFECGADAPAKPVNMAHLKLLGVTHQFARDTLHACAKQCGLIDLPELYLDLALMRIIEPASKRRTIKLIAQYFNVHYAPRTVYRTLPKLLSHQKAIESAAIQTAQSTLKESFSLVLYDVTTLYFESFKEYDLQRPGFSKDNKPQQPQIVIGLLTTRAGFPVMHEVFEGNTFEGNTMLSVIQRFQARFGDAKPIIVADAAMLSQKNMQQLNHDGYQFIVGARLANMSSDFIKQIDNELERVDGERKRFFYRHSGHEGYPVICEFKLARYKKDKRDFDKQVQRANTLVGRNEPGRRAKFVKKSERDGKLFILDEVLKSKTEKLLGIKGYVTNIAEEQMPPSDIVGYYHDLWHIEQAFRISKSDLKTRPIFHRTEEAIRAHILICFIGLMLGKYIEIKTGLSLRHVRDLLWQVHEALVVDESTQQKHALRTEISAESAEILSKITKNSH